MFRPRPGVLTLLWFLPLLLPGTAAASLTVGSNTESTASSSGEPSQHFEMNGDTPPTHSVSARTSHSESHAYGFWSPGSAQAGAILSLHADLQSGPYADGNSRITLQSYNLVFTSQDPHVTQVNAAMHVHVRWSVELPAINCGDLNDCNAYFFAGMGPTNLAASLGSLGCGGVFCGQQGSGEADFVTPPGSVQMNLGYSLGFEVQGSGRVGLCATDFASRSVATVSLSFPPTSGPGGSPVFDLPPGVTANCPEFGIVDNHWTGATTCAAILQGPSDQAVAAGSPVALTATASGADTLHWQWYRNGVALSDGGTLSGATTPNLAISAAAATDSGLYRVAVDNGCVPDTSAGARLSVNSATAVGGPGASPGRPRLTGLGSQPARGPMSFTVQMPEPGRAALEILRVDGRTVALLPERPVPAGFSRLTWDARSMTGERAPSGVYIVRLIANGLRMDARKVLLLR